MSSSKQITECFKMKKPRVSPDKCATSGLTTPKRCTKKTKITPNKRGLSTPGKKKGSGRDGSPYRLEQNFYESAMGHDLIVDDLLCSQDVVSADVVWDCSYSKSGILKARRNGESDVKNLVKHFRTKPLEPEKPSTSVLNIVGTRYHTAQEARCSSPRASTMAPSGEQRKSPKIMSAQMIMKEMQKLLGMMSQPKQDRVEENAAVSGVSAPMNADESTAAVEEPSTSRSLDEDKWDVDDDSFLVAATQEVEKAAHMRTPQRVAVSPKVVPPTSCLGSSDFVSPLRRCLLRASPKEGTGVLRKSPRLRLLSLNRTPSPLRQRSVVPIATVTAETTADSVSTVESPGQRLSRTGSDPLFDDDEDEILDRICSTYEDQQELDRKTGASATEAASSLTSKFTSNLVENGASPRTRRRSSACAARALMTLPNGTHPPIPEKSNSSITQNRANQVPRSRALAAVNGPSTSCTRASIVNKPASFVAPRVQVSLVSKAPTTHLGAQSSGLNQKKSQSTSTNSRNGNLFSEVLNKPESRSISRPTVRPFSSLASTSSATRVMTAPPKVHRVSKSPARAQQGGKAKIPPLAKPAEPVPDFDDDDMDLATPEVMSWLEKVESQRSTSQKCTPEEIAKKREEALLRRKLKEAQERHQRKARVRPAR